MNFIKKFLYQNIYKIYIIFFPKRKLSSQLADFKNLNKKQTVKILFPVIETSHYQIFQLLLLAKVLEMRGAKIKILLCGSSLKGCEIKSFKNEKETDPCWKCRFNENNLVKIFNLDVCHIGEFLNKSDINLINKTLLKKKIPSKWNKVINDSVSRYYFGGAGNHNSKKIKLNHYNTILKILVVSRKLHKSFKPNLIINNMQAYSSFDPMFQYFKSKNIICKIISMTTFNYKSVVVDLFDLMQSDKRFQLYLKYRNNKKLNFNENKKLNIFLKKRFHGKDEHLQKNQFVDDKKIINDFDDIIIANKKKKNVFLFSNLHWDVGLTDQSTLFKDVKTWILETIDFFKNKPDFHLFIKPHPAEDFSKHRSLLTVEKMIEMKFGKIPDHVSIIKKEYKVNIFNYLKYVDICLVYSGTLGIEMLLNKKKVISAGKTFYQKFLPEIKNKKKYFQMIENFKKIKNPDIESIRLFAYFFFLKTPIPWTLSDKVFNQRIADFKFKNLNDLLPKKDKYLDHLVNVLLDNKKLPEAW